MNGLSTICFLGKTECILLWPKPKLKTITDFKVNSNGHLTKSQSSVKYIGINCYKHLSFERTTNTIIRNVNSHLRFMYRKANCLLKQEEL